MPKAVGRNRHGALGGGCAATPAVGPKPHEKGALTWTECPKRLARLTEPGAYDWRRTRKAWHFQAFARDARATVFYVKTPPFLLYVDELARHFRDAKFLFMVRNPYAMCEGICRNLRGASLERGRDLPTVAARHAVACLAHQRRNVERHRERGAFFSYEDMCAAPVAVEARIRGLVPELEDLSLRQRLPVKGRYHELLTNMNGRQIARLGAREVAALNRVFEGHCDLLEHFGYEILD